jgi:hypothetical protein
MEPIANSFADQKQPKFCINKGNLGYLFCNVKFSIGRGSHFNAPVHETCYTCQPGRMHEKADLLYLRYTKYVLNEMYLRI